MTDTRLIRVWAAFKSAGTCRYCGAPIVWRITAKNGKNVPFDPGALSLGTSRDTAREISYETLSSEHCHFATCTKRPPPPEARA